MADLKTRFIMNFITDDRWKYLADGLVVTLKVTFFAGYIALQDLTKGGDIIRSRTYDAFMPLIAVALIYLVMVMVFTKCVNLLERRLRNSDH